MSDVVIFMLMCCTALCNLMVCYKVMLTRKLENERDNLKRELRAERVEKERWCEKFQLQSSQYAVLIGKLGTKL